RRLIEGFAAARICEAGSGAPKEMVALAAEMRTVGSSDLRVHVELDRAYHRALVKGCANHVLVEVCDGLRARQQQVAYAAVRADPSRLGTILDEHDLMVIALEAGDTDEVVSLLNRHLQPIAQVLATLR
ncbi:MAG: FCD domain-containing protein, partial [Pseudomonadota bacterium]